MPVPAAPPVAIAGLGFLGRALADALAAAHPDSPIHAISRTCPEGPVPNAIRHHALDLRTAPRADIITALGPARSLVICLAAGRTQDPRELYLGATARLLDACADRPLARVVYTSSTSALPDRDGWLDDDCPDPPDHPRGQIQRAAEDLVRTTCEAHGAPWLILRLAGLYGPGRPLFRIYRDDPGATQPGDGMQATNLVHRDDAVQACLAALALSPTTSAIVNVCDDDHRPRRAMFAALAAAAGRPEPAWELPPGPLHGKRVRNDRLKQLLGVTLRHPEHDLSP